MFSSSLTVQGPARPPRRTVRWQKKMRRRVRVRDKARRRSWRMLCARRVQEQCMQELMETSSPARQRSRGRAVGQAVVTASPRNTSLSIEEQEAVGVRGVWMQGIARGSKYPHSLATPATMTAVRCPPARPMEAAVETARAWRRCSHCNSSSSSSNTCRARMPPWPAAPLTPKPSPQQRQGHLQCLPLTIIPQLEQQGQPTPVFLLTSSPGPHAFCAPPLTLP
mmetsp:Transcript_22319/g.58181  ORF Transcript_22319/g.58181 Transcript_22319/m.58181 type:complete len:223 (+) Transcript_22319:875-1543(+)